MNKVTNMIPVTMVDDESVLHRPGKRRYPWWVKTVDKLTTETDDSRHEKPDLNILAHYAVYEGKEIARRIEKSRKVVAKAIKKRVQGKSTRDLALHYAAGTYQTWTIGSLGDPYVNKLPGSKEIQNTWKLHPPQTLGLPVWETDKQDAHSTIQRAAIQLGAAMVGVTTLKSEWTNSGTTISPDVDKLTREGGKVVIPERMKYVISVLGVNPPGLTRRNQTELGAAGDRAGYEAAFMATTRLMRFIKGLGYSAIDAQNYVPVIPYAIESGLGELGRMNRMINPIFGGNIRIGTIITDFPMALDKPIDFGLQKFCEGCKKCAKACPVNALSKADKPYWDPVNQWQASGKKTYYEDTKSCFDYQMTFDTYCSTCMSVCPWSKQDNTLLHDLARIVGSKLPFLSKYITFLDDLFGYGLVTDSKQVDDWWSEETPVRGIDSKQGRRL